MNKVCQRKVVGLLKQLYANRSVEDKNLRVYTVVFSKLNSVVQLHTVWRQTTWHGDEEVSQADDSTKAAGSLLEPHGMKAHLVGSFDSCTQHMVSDDI